MERKRESGVLLHISSLPSKYGIGDLGENAYSFIDMLDKNDFSIWQILPLGPLGPGNSPYQAYSAYAGDPIYISPNELVKWGLISDSDLDDYPKLNRRKVEFEKVIENKEHLFKIAFNNFLKVGFYDLQQEYAAFLNEHSWWLNDYALFMACSNHFQNERWNQWEEPLAKRNPSAIEQYNLILSEEISFEKFKQFLFMRQLFRLKNYANERGILIFGDVPLYVSLNSSDVWANQSIFMLDDKGNPTLVGGVPPDYFSEDGQLWGNPLFNWDQLAETNFHWWLARLYFNLHLFNLVRIDHFRGLESFWAIPSDAVTAKQGQWLPAKGFEVLSILQSQIGNLPIIAEDLGIITPEVEKLRDHFNLPGMKVLQFAFTSDFTNEHLPHNLKGRNVMYTGTHDNNTALGWWQTINVKEKMLASQFLSSSKDNMVQRLIELAWSSTAELAILPMQDLMELGEQARMNVPGTATGNWAWRYEKKQLKESHWTFMKKMNTKYNRKRQ
jgi:4-alpha-glucanotransferase